MAGTSPAMTRKDRWLQGTAHEIGAITRHLRSQRDLLEGKWHEHFGN